MLYRSGALAGSFMLGLSIACNSGGGGNPIVDHGACELLIECASSLAPESRDEFIATYGQFGTCWQGGPQQWAACRESCRAALDALNLIAMTTGDACGTCQSDADCAQYGVGAYCDAGLCLGGGGQSDGETGDSNSGDGDGDGDPGVTFEAVSILLVVDNTASMADHQRNLASASYDLVAPLEAAGIPWRLGVTTTDNGNPWCASTTPEAGRLVLSSCTARSGDFLFNNGELDASDHACFDICSSSVSTVPSTTALDADAAPRPWIESNGSQTNIDGGIALDEALRCVIPQGINGCGFESQLYSAYLTVARSEANDQSEYGFVEPGRLLVVVFVTDEADCSYNPDWEEIFDQDGDKTFWSDPSASFPTSAVCWNAGMQCLGDPSNYNDCVPVDLDVDGNSTTDPDLAVLRPVQGIIDGMGDPDEVRVFGIVGAAADGSVHYSDVGATDPEYQLAFGIGPGCTAPPAEFGPVQAVPPGRILTVMEQLGPSGQLPFSICESNFQPALTAIGEAIAAEF